MVGENLDAGADDKRHEEEVQEVLHSQPSRKTGGDDPRRRCHAGISHEKILHRRQFSQCLSYGHADDDEHKTEWQRPQHVYPTLANPNFWHHADLRRQPVVQENTIVRRAKVCLNGIVLMCNFASFHHS